MGDYSSYMWSVPDWRTDEMWHNLDNREKGIYREIIDQCWVGGSIPSDPVVLARLVYEPADYFAQVWMKIRPKFKSIQGGERLVHPRLEKDRQRLRGVRKKRVDAGARGNAEKRRRREAAANAKGSHTEEQWKALLILAGFCCVRCGYQPSKLQKDHIIPLYQGGSNSIENIQPLCVRCNSSKGPESQDFREFDWRQLIDFGKVSRICESFANAKHSPDSDTDSDTDKTEESIPPLKDSPNLKNSPPDTHSSPAAPASASDLFAIYNQNRGGLPEAKALTKERAAKCKARLARNNGSFVSDWTRAIQRAAKTAFCLGDGAQGWKATFDWFVSNDTNYIKVLEGKYDGQQKSKTDRNAEAARRLLSRLDSENRSRGDGGDLGSDTGGLFGTTTPAKRE